MKNTKAMVTKGEEITWEGEIVQVTSERDGIIIREREHAIELMIPETGHHSDIITVYKPHTMYGDQHQPAEINWSALGSVSSAIAGKFCKAMEIAIELAALLDAQEA